MILGSRDSVNGYTCGNIVHPLVHRFWKTTDGYPLAQPKGSAASIVPCDSARCRESLKKPLSLSDLFESWLLENTLISLC